MKLGFRGLVVGALVAAFGVASAQNLTGVTWYTIDISKHFSGGYANTYGGDSYSRNLYVTENQGVGAGPLLNRQNLTTMPTRINVDLSLPGTYNFTMYVNDESTVLNPWWGMNLFFDGNDTSPGISVWNTVNAPGFTTVNPIGTPTLDPLTMGLVQSGTPGGNIVYKPNSSPMVITITAYSTWSTNHYNVDRVDNFSDVGGLGNGTKDGVIEFTLNVAPVPEPASLIGLATMAAGVISRRRRSRKR